MAFTTNRPRLVCPGLVTHTVVVGFLSHIILPIFNFMKAKFSSDLSFYLYVSANVYLVICTFIIQA